MSRNKRLYTALFFAATFLYMPPLIDAVNQKELIAGLPATPLYLFSTWGLVVALAWLAGRRR